MIPAGYMAKRVADRDDWLKADGVVDIYSVSGCMSDYFDTYYFEYWKHNGHWLFDSPEIITELAGDNSIDIAGVKFFYYEIYEHEFHEDDMGWHRYDPDRTFGENVKVPDKKKLEGYDVATFMCGATPECSPLSCNGLAEEIETNQHCLIDSFERAKQCLEDGLFNNSEPGPYRIFAVYSFE